MPDDMTKPTEAVKGEAPAKKKPSTVITALGPHNGQQLYKAQRGRILVYFTVSKDYKLTLYDKSLTKDGVRIKDYHFEDSDPFIVANVSKVINTVAWHVVNLKKEAEAADASSK